MAARLMLSDVVDEYVRLQRNKASATTAEIDSTVLSMFLRMTGDRVAKNLTADHIEAWFYGKGGLRETHTVLTGKGTTRVVKGISDASHNHYRTRIKAFVTWAVNKGYMKSGLVADAFDRRHGAVRPLKIHREPRQRPAPTTLLALLEHADNPRDRAYLATAINTALRSSEIRSLRVGAVNLEAGIIVVRIHKTGDRDEQPITMDLDRELRSWLVQYSEDIGRPLDNDDYLFPNRTGGMISHYDITEDGERVAVRHPYRWVTTSPVRNTHVIVQRSLRALGLPTHKEGTHTIRRAVARAYFDQVAREVGDVSALRETAALLHHQNITTTEIYLGTTPERENRDRRLKGQPFLSAMVEGENVVPLRKTATGE